MSVRTTVQIANIWTIARIVPTLVFRLPSIFLSTKFGILTAHIFSAPVRTSIFRVSVHIWLSVSVIKTKLFSTLGAISTRTTKFFLSRSTLIETGFCFPLTCLKIGTVPSSFIPRLASIFLTKTGTMSSFFPLSVERNTSIFRITLVTVVVFYAVCKVSIAVPGFPSMFVPIT